MVMIIACMMFGSLSGSGVADVVAIGTMMLPAMKDQGYAPGFSASALGCAGSLGTVIPPSIVLIVYGTATNSSIGQLFVAAILPGILLGLGCADHKENQGPCYDGHISAKSEQVLVLDRVEPSDHRQNHTPDKDDRPGNGVSDNIHWQSLFHLRACMESHPGFERLRTFSCLRSEFPDRLLTVIH